MRHALIFRLVAFGAVRRPVPRRCGSVKRKGELRP